jgi:phosphatidylserine/phosphatidylglycerophosphate/cardiolipin synthase-like enzyme
MKVSKNVIELAEEIKKYRTDERVIREIAIEKESLEKQNKELENGIKILKLDIIEKNELREKIMALEEDNKRLKLNLKNSEHAYKFIVTTPNNSLDTVYGEISTELSKAQKEILICSPWITYIIEELYSSFKKKEKINIRIITRLIKEDIEKGVTDLEKFRVLKNIGAEIRYNNDLHAKMVIVDGLVAVISSANLTGKGMSVNYEAGISLRDEKMADNVRQFFNYVWEESKPLTEESIKLCLNGE